MNMVLDSENIEANVPRRCSRTLKMAAIAMAIRKAEPIARKGIGNPGNIDSNLARSYPPIRLEIMYAGSDIVMTILDSNDPALASNQPRLDNTRPMPIMMMTETTLPIALSIAAYYRATTRGTLDYFLIFVEDLDFE